MPVEPSNLPVNLAAAEQSQLLQAASLISGLAADRAASVRSHDQGKREAADEVQQARPVEFVGVARGGGGGGAAGAPAGGAARGDKEAPGERPGEGPPPDPEGRGRVIDMRL